MNNNRLTRSTTDTYIGGVCGGIAQAGQCADHQAVGFEVQGLHDDLHGECCHDCDNADPNFVRKNSPPRSSTRLYPVHNMRTNAPGPSGAALC